MSVNSYFQIIYTESNETWLKVYPKVDEGKSLTYEEVSNYLTKHNLTQYNAVELNRLLVSDIGGKIRVSDKKTGVENEEVIFMVSKDSMKAYMRFYMPSEGGNLLTKEDIYDELKRFGIRFGIIDEMINRFLADRKYCTTYKIAVGIMPVDGHDAQIKYYFKLDKSFKPKVNEDGTVDFHSLDNINNVNAGDVLAELIPMDPGKPGTDVLGARISPKKVKNEVLKHGNNISVSEDGLKLISDVQGHVELNGDRVFVSNTYEVADNVDASTGDIIYSGNVHVPGSVMSGYTIQAQGDIIIDGSVECAHLIAGGNIVIKRGVMGHTKGTLDAKGDIISKFIESAHVKCGGEIHAESIMYSEVSAKGAIVLSGKKGNIVGGKVRSLSSVSCKTLGSTMETKTEIEVGIDPDVLTDYKELEQEIANMQTELRKCEQIIELIRKKITSGEQVTSDKITMLSNATQTYKKYSEDIVIKAAEFKRLKGIIDSVEGGNVVVTGTAYLGVKLVISNVVYYIRRETSHIQFVKDKGEVKERMI